MKWKSAALAVVAAAGIAGGFSVTAPADAVGGISTEAALQAALDSGARSIGLARHAVIRLTTGLTHTGANHVTIAGRNAVLDGRRLGGVDAMVFSGGGNVTLRDLRLQNGPRRGLVVEVPVAETGSVIVRLTNVSVRAFAGHGVHVDDSAGSDASVRIGLDRVVLLNNGIHGGLSYDGGRDGVLVEEAGLGGLIARVTRCDFTTNKHDGLSLVESGDGDVRCQVFRCNFTRNGNSVDGPNDGIDIDESGPGSVRALLHYIRATANTGEGIDIDEADDGDMTVALRRIEVDTSRSDGVQVNESGNGNLTVEATTLFSDRNSGDGLEIGEADAGNLVARLRHGGINRNRAIGLNLTQGGSGTGLAYLRRFRRFLNRGGNTVTSGVTIK